MNCCDVDNYLINQEKKKTKLFVFSEKGSLFLNSNDSILPLMEYKGNFSRKARGGYSNPFLSDNGKFVVCQYRNGSTLNSKTDICLIDVEKYQSTKLIEQDSYFKPQLSDDMKFLLLAKNSIIDKDGERKDEVSLYDISSNYALDIAVSNNYIFIK